MKTISNHEIIDVVKATWRQTTSVMCGEEAEYHQHWRHHVVNDRLMVLRLYTTNQTA